MAINMSSARNTISSLRNDALLLLLALGVLPLDAVGGASQDFEVRLTSPRESTCAPGKILTASLVVANYRPTSADLVEEMQLPPGWKLIGEPRSTFNLPAHGDQVRLIAFAVPQQGRPGRF